VSGQFCQLLTRFSIEDECNPIFTRGEQPSPTRKEGHGCHSTSVAIDLSHQLPGATMPYLCTTLLAGNSDMFTIRKDRDYCLANTSKRCQYPL
jgi:hypothetical protein